MSHLDDHFMDLALAQAERGLGRTAPNPAVGCVIVRNGEVLSTGYHRRAGQPHAEVEALAPLGGTAPGATAYVTLEPCNHVGRTGPCSEALIAAGVARVVAGTVDPNPQVAGAGLDRLRAAGVAVTIGVREQECRRVIAGFVSWITRGEPRVTVKLASSLDGRIATATGESQWITGAAARADVHRRRDQTDAILIGAGTLRADDPSLTTRLDGGGGRNATRVVVVTGPTLDTDRALFHDGAARTIVAAGALTTEAASALEALGVEPWIVGRSDGGADLGALLRRLGQDGITTVLVEGGGRLAASLLRARRVDAVAWYTAPLLIGGDGRAALDGFGIGALAGAPRLTDVRLRTLGDDLCIDGDVRYHEPRRFGQET